MRHYTRPLAEFITSRARTPQDAEDIVQETFLKAYANLGKFNPRYSLKNWLFTIAYRLLVSLYRKRRPVRLSNETAAGLSEPAPRRDDGHDWLWSTVREMGPDAYTVLWLRYREEMCVEDIARIMRKSRGAVRVLLSRTRSRLADRMTAEPKPACVPDEWAPPKTIITERTK